MLKQFLIIILCALSQQSWADGSAVMKLTSNSIVFIQSNLSQGKSMTGSGVIFLEDEIITNCHVIKGAEKITVQFSDGVKMPATVKGRVGNLDMCALSTITGKRPKVTVANISNIKVGQQIYAIGNPLNLKLTISDGIVSALRDVDSEKLIQITAPISNGSSGGGVFDQKGRLLGITTFTLTQGQNLNFAIPVEYRKNIGLSPIDTAQSVSTNDIQSNNPSANNSSKTTSLVCRGPRTQTINLEHVDVTQVAIPLDINLDEKWVAFRDDWGCNLDHGKKFGDDFLCRSKLPVYTLSDKNKFSFHESNDNINNKPVSWATTFDINRQTGELYILNIDMPNSEGRLWHTRTIEMKLNCAQESNKF